MIFQPALGRAMLDSGMHSTAYSATAARTTDQNHNIPAAKEWRRFAFHFLSVLVLVLFAVASLNFFINPKGLYPTPSHVPAFGSGRDLKPALLRNEAGKSKILILGSSRCRLVKPSLVEQITGMRTFNASVESATADDYLSILRDAFAHGESLKAMVVCLDVESFLSHADPAANDSQQVPADISESTNHKASELLTWEQTMLSIESMVPSLTPLIDTSGTSFNAKGETTYQRGLEPQHSTKQLDVTKENLILYKALYRDSQISTQKLRSLQELLRQSQKRGMRSVVLLTPLSSEFQSALRPLGWEEKREQLKEMIKPMCVQSDAEFLDLTFPYSFGGDSSDFVDGVHLSQVGADRMTRQISGSLISALH
jgi:hypothetical protein